LLPLSYVLSEQEKHSEAEPLYLQLVQYRKKVHGDTDPATLAAIRLLGASLLDQKEYAEAEPLLLDAANGFLSIRDTTPSMHFDETTKALERLVQLYSEWEKPEPAHAWKTQLEKHCARANETVPDRQ
jgi:hypothetical protein